ncbi:hypothetical protein FCV25MIE_07901 [Fagus crenata]
MSDLKRVGILARVDRVLRAKDSPRGVFSDALRAPSYLSSASESHDLLLFGLDFPLRMSRRLSVLWSVCCELHLQITPAQPHRHVAPKP